MSCLVLSTRLVLSTNPNPNLVDWSQMVGNFANQFTVFDSDDTNDTVIGTGHYMLAIRCNTNTTDVISCVIDITLDSFFGKFDLVNHFPVVKTCDANDVVFTTQKPHVYRQGTHKYW